MKILFENSSLKQAKLYNAAKKASENPSIGIQINNPAAAHVIKDCAEITLKFLPLYVFLGYEKPFDQLSGKFKKTDVEEFVASCSKDLFLSLLLNTIVARVQKDLPHLFFSSVQEVPSSVIQSNLNDDPYGDYQEEIKQPAETVKQKSPLEILLEAFKAS
ncbi:MAG: hypothetical protein KGR46_07750 [Verrucomicrobia bacterium]|nr:hypothetical protein [Verrucomicrobiota bacterium]